MIFKPVDEYSLRHLFSMKYSQELLHLSYLGPVLDSSGQIESSPDCMILDMRKSPFRALRCEFKFLRPKQDMSEFSRNGKFDIAIIWGLPNGFSKAQAENYLLEHNGCFELIVLDQMKAFHDLPAYTLDSLSRVSKFGGDIIKNLAIKRSMPSVIALYMAAKLAPRGFKLDRMVNFLATRFQEVAKMRPQGRANVVSAFLQTTPPLLEYMHGKTYCWTSDFDSEFAAQVLAQLIRVNFQNQVPANQDLDFVI